MITNCANPKGTLVDKQETFDLFLTNIITSLSV